ncbi:guanylate kinase [Melioribacteraceae bacterium 4301-Me]|uniref:guanylate kinase n=1 Tax=Pyranulibacter aquaticus TaxID=3163344 RepID=UPI00359C0260
MHTKKVKLFVFSAPSGSGKTTIVKSVLLKHSDFVFSVSATTRKPRNSEKDGKDYFFISEEEFKEKIRNNEFIEYEKVYDYYYGTLKDFVEKSIAGGHSVVFEVDVKGALSIKQKYPEAVLIFIVPPSIEELKKRLLDRKTETTQELKKRIERAEMELSYKDKFDYVVSNENLEEAKKKVYEIINKEIN